MEARITIRMDNAAFEYAGVEVARILREVATRLADYAVLGEADGFVVVDINGNKVGELEFHLD